MIKMCNKSVYNYGRKVYIDYLYGVIFCYVIVFLFIRLVDFIWCFLL